MACTWQSSFRCEARFMIRNTIDELNFTKTNSASLWTKDLNQEETGNSLTHTHTKRKDPGGNL